MDWRGLEVRGGLWYSHEIGQHRKWKYNPSQEADSYGIDKGSCIVLDIASAYGPFLLLGQREDRPVARKPTYEELEQRIAELEKKRTERGRAEEQMALFRRFTETSGEGLGMADLQGHVIYANPTLCRFMGEEGPEDPIGKDVRTYYSEKDLPKLENEILPAVFKKGQETAEIPLLSLKGELTPTIQNVFLIRNGQGEPVCLANVITDMTEWKRAEEELKRHRDHLEEVVAERTRDIRKTNEELQREITERKLVEEAFRESEEKYRELVDLLPETIFEIDEKGDLTFTNRCGFESFGYSQEDLDTGLSALQMFIPEDRDRVTENIREVLTSQEPGRNEYTALRKDGSTFPVITCSGCIVRDGKPVGLRGIVIDITERKRAEEALLESEQTFRTLFDLSPQGIALTETRTGRLVNVNERFCELTKHTRRETVGRTTTECGFYSKEDRGRFTRKLLESGRVRGLEMDFRAKDGSIVNTLMFANLVRIGGEERILTVFLDMTEVKQLEAKLLQAQKLKAIGTLAGGIAHDFNNLLTVVQARASLMLEGIDFTHPDYGHLKAIEHQVESGSRLTRQLLGYARKGKYDVKPVSLNRLVEETSNTFGRTRKDIVIQRGLADGVCAIMADQGQIEQILLNLYINAADAMPRGGELTLRTVELSHEEMKDKLYEPKPGRYILLTVTDTGKGMDEETRQRIFEPFYSTKEVERGTGLGLASAYGIVKSHAGYIDVDSEPGVGTTFSIYFPASEEQVQQVSSAPEQILEGSGTALVVDDEPQVLSACADVLKQMGYEVLLAGNGKEAIESYRQNKDRIDIVILDVIMPGMRGGEVYDKMKEITPRAKVLLLSGYSVDGEASEILERGCNGFLQKPFSLQELSGKLKEVIEPKQES